MHGPGRQDDVGHPTPDLVPLVAATRVTKAYGVAPVIVHALRDVTLSIPRGEFVVVLGPSGCGKTTLLNILGGIETLTSGELTIDKNRIDRLDAQGLERFRRENVGFVFQFFNLVPTLTAQENVELAAQLSPRSLPADEVLRDVGLGHRLDHYPGELSGGEQQRVAIARALVRKPALLLADEPTGALDADNGRRVLALLQRFNRERGVTVFLVTHNAAISQLAHRVIRMKDGTVASADPNPHPLEAGEVAW